MSNELNRGWNYITANCSLALNYNRVRSSNLYIFVKSWILYVYVNYVRVVMISSMLDLNDIIENRYFEVLT